MSNEKAEIVYFPNELLSVVLNLIKVSLETGIFPQALKQAVAKPYFKNVNLDSEDYANYRTISNLIYTSKLLERSALLHFTDHLVTNALFCAFQSAIERLAQQKAPL